MVLRARSAKRRHCHDKGNAGRLPQPPSNRAGNLSFGDCFCFGAVVELVGSLGVELVWCHEESVIWGVRRAGLFSHFSGTIMMHCCGRGGGEGVLLIPGYR